MVYVLWLESCCQIGKLWDHRYWLVVPTGVDGMTPSATCSSIGARVRAEAPGGKAWTRVFYGQRGL